MFPKFLRSRPNFALDLGTRNFLFSDSRSILHQDQTFVARSKRDSKNVFLSGQIATEVFEKDPGHFDLIQPLNRGVVSDSLVCSQLLKGVLRKWAPTFSGLNLLVTTPLDITEVERKAFEFVALNAGAHRVHCLPETSAAALGLVKNFVDQRGVLFVDVGAGITEAVLYSLGGVVVNASIRLGGDDLENELISFLRRRHQFRIGRKTATELISLLALDRNEMLLAPIRIKGWDLRTAMPGSVEVEGLDLENALERLFVQIIEPVRSVLRQAPEELTAEIMDRGIYLSGGASQFPRFHELLREATGLGIQADLQPLLGVARGEIELLQNPQLLEFLSRAS
jgi:rod shape-determining protein MreB and related proteins